MIPTTKKSEKHKMIVDNNKDTEQILHRILVFMPTDVIPMITGYIEILPKGNYCGDLTSDKSGFPLGIATDGEKIYVAENVRGKILVFKNNEYLFE